MADAPDPAAAGAARSVTAAELVGEDQDHFPGTASTSQGAGSTTAPGATGGDQAPPKAPDANATIEPDEKKNGTTPPKHAAGYKGEKRPPEQHVKAWQTRRRNARQKQRPDFSDVRQGKEAEAVDPEDQKLEEEFAQFKADRAAGRPSVEIDYDAMAEMIFGLGTDAISGIFGPAWKPRVGTITVPGKNGEPSRTLEFDDSKFPKSSLAEYMRRSKMPDIPPGWVLALALSTYAATRFRDPTTVERVRGIWGWVRSKFKKGKKADKFTPHVVVPSGEERKVA